MMKLWRINYKIKKDALPPEKQVLVWALTRQKAIDELADYIASFNASSENKITDYYIIKVEPYVEEVDGPKHFYKTLSVSNYSTTEPDISLLN